MKYIKTLKIDIDKKNFEVIPSVQYDSNTRFLHIQLLNDSVPFDITGCSVILSGVKEDGNPIFNSCDIINSEIGFIQAEVTEQMNAIPGYIDCEIKIYNGEGVLTSKKFTIKVTASQTSREVESSGEFKALTEAVNKVNNIDNKMNRGEKIKVSQLDKNTGKIDQTYLSDSVLQMMAGNTPVNATPADGSITTEKMASYAVKPSNIYKREGILLNAKSIEVNFQTLKATPLTTDMFILGPDGYVAIKPDDNSLMLPTDISPDAINGNIYTLFSLWFDPNSKTINFSRTGVAPSNGILLASFYHGKPYVNNMGNGLVVIDKNGNRVDTSLTQVKESLSADINNLKGNMNNHKYATIYNGYIDVQPYQRKVICASIGLIFTSTGYYSVNINEEISWADTPNPNFARFIYFDTKTSKIVISPMQSQNTPNTYYLICATYDGEIFQYLDGRNIKLNGKFITDVEPNNYSLRTTKLANPLRSLLNKNSLRVDFKDLKVYVNTELTYYATEYNYIDMRGQGGAKLLDIDIPAESLSVYALFSLWFDPVDRVLKFDRSAHMPSNGIHLGMFYMGKPYMDNYGGGITVYDRYGTLVPTSFDQINTQGSANGSSGNCYFYTEDTVFDIAYDKTENTITVIAKQGRWVMFENGGVNILEDKVYVHQATSSSLGYAYKLFVNKSTGEPKIVSHTGGSDADTINKYGFVCMFTQGKIHTPNFSPSIITIDGKTPTVVAGLGGSGSISNGNYDWENNRFVIPSDLYLVKDVPYSIHATNFNMQQLVDNDDCLYEITLPTKVMQFEQSADIQIPFVYDKPFRTRLAGKYKGKNSMLTKDINLHVADPSIITKKTAKVLCIGDSITNSNFPKHLKWQLSQFGIDATMIGTVVCSHETYSYGISKYLSAEKGEGRGGWRLTDFCCNTPLKEGGYYKPSFVMMNPETQQFDFDYYMRTQQFDGVDFVVINMGTNDMSGYHYAGSPESNPMYGKIRKVDLDTEYLNPDSEYYLGKLYSTLIDSIHAYDPNIKIAINPPMTSGTSSFIISSMKWAEITQYALKDKNNVYHLGAYLSQGLLSACTIEGARDRLTQVNEKNDTLKSSSVIGDVHVNGMGQLIHSLYPASWIVNMCK